MDVNLDDKINPLDFTIDRDNLYREESYTDLKTAAVRKMVPVKQDGSEDTSRTPIFIGTTQILTPQGPLPIQSRLQANNLEEAWKEFAPAMARATEHMVAELKKLQREESSGIVVPGR